MSLKSCMGCGGKFPESNGPKHRYIGASAGCWACYRMVVERVSRNPDCQWVYRLALDAYAVQHPGKPSRHNARTVALHLISLCGFFEGGVELDEMCKAIRRASKERVQFEWLHPPSGRGGVTVADISRAADSHEHAYLVRLWAELVWSAWSEYHHTIRGWLSEIILGRVNRIARVE